MLFTNCNTKKKIIALVDCNSFYVSCERLFNPKISQSPVVVLSNNDGCVIARSSEAKKIGIKMGEPYFKIKNIVTVNNVQVFSSNYALYGDISRRIMTILKNLFPIIEYYSIDEAFLDLSNMSIKNMNNLIIDIKKITARIHHPRRHHNILPNLFKTSIRAQSVLSGAPSARVGWGACRRNIPFAHFGKFSVEPV